MTTTNAVSAKPMSVLKPEASTPRATDIVTLKTLRAELKLDPRLAREKLRIAVREAKKFPELAKAHKPRGAWEWSKGSKAEEEARAALAG